MVRAFVAIGLNEEIRQKLISVQGSLPAAGLKLVEPENIHLTLKFLGEVPEEKIVDVTKNLESAVSGVQKFNTRIKGIGVFQSLRNMRVIWAGVDEGREKIIEIQRKIDSSLKNLGFVLDDSFHPHATIARVKFVKDKVNLVESIKERTNEDFGLVEVSGIELKQSKLTPQGPIYSTLAEIKLL